ncbi:9797_t:CDS:2 [Acaulospora colombiana]|uniref:9797_t:CDS:1 n=1 Tax=Acaulospora colombiana TaxID=27376 RepID=A0ACA9KQN2_9GLOM|nr:9797_t:CDS:2 [Acaulospora colombiana]
MKVKIVKAKVGSRKKKIVNSSEKNYESITIPTEVLVEKYDSKTPNYILLGNNWFYGRNNDGLQTYLPEIVTDAENAFVRTTLRIKDLSRKQWARPTKYFLGNRKIHYPTDQISLQLLIRALLIQILQTTIQVILPHLGLDHASHNEASISDTNLITL